MHRWINYRALWIIMLSAAFAVPAQAQTWENACQTGGVCDDGQFCNGQETCDGATCLSGPQPCPGRACSEEVDICVPGQSPRIEGGWLTVGETPKPVLLSNRYDRPVVVTGIHYGPTDPPLVVRIRQITSETLELYLQNPSGATAPVRRVSYLVVEEGSWEVEGKKFEAQRLPSTTTDVEGQMVGAALAFQQTYKNPVVLGQVMSARDSAWSVFWAGGQIVQNAPSWNASVAGKTVGGDSQPAREEEVLGVVVFESGDGWIGAANFQAGVTAPAVTGIENAGKPYQHRFAKAFDQPPEVAIASVAGLADPDVGWAMIPASNRSGQQAVGSRTEIPLVIDEDQLDDLERVHGPERVAYVVFDRPFSFQAVPEPIIGYPGGSDYYYCRLDPSNVASACSDATSAIQQSVAACEQTVDNCASSVSLAGNCGSCLSPFPSWKKNPIAAIVFCVPQCGIALLDFFQCQKNAQRDLRFEVDAQVCDLCHGSDCENRYGLDISATGLGCNEAVLANVSCPSDSQPTQLPLTASNPTLDLPNWCTFPNRWDVEISEVFDLSTNSAKRECTPIRREGPPGATNGATVQTQFDCTCSGAECDLNSTSFPLFADVSCMAPNSWFKLRTVVSNACGEVLNSKDIRVDYSSSNPITRFPVGISARPGDKITSTIIASAPGASCFNEAPSDSTMPTNPPGGNLTVAQLRCNDSNNFGTGGSSAYSGCGGSTVDVELKGTVSGPGLSARPNGVTVNLTVDGVQESMTVQTSPYTFQISGSPGDIYSVDVADPVYSFGTGGDSKSICRALNPVAGTIPNSDSFQIANVVCSLAATIAPPIPPTPPNPEPEYPTNNGPIFCEFTCDENPPPPPSILVPCDPCIYCRQGNSCAPTCFCEFQQIPGGRCTEVCDELFNPSPSLSVTTGSSQSTNYQLKADDVLKVSGNATDSDGLQGFILSLNGQYEDHVITNGTSGSFSGLTVDTSSLPPGDHMLRVIAIDDHSTATSTAFTEIPFEIDRTVDPCEGDTSPPGAVFTTPAAGANLTPGLVTIGVHAVDPGVGVKHVKFYVDNQLLGLDHGAPYQWDWTATPGTHIIKFWAVDHCNRGRTDEITVTVADACTGLPEPTVAITNYQDGQWVDPGLFFFEAGNGTASSSGIDRVEFEVASFSNVAVDTTAPFASTGWWFLSEQTETITARAFDSCGRVATDTITLHVDENSSVCGVDQDLPAVQVLQPAEGTTVAAGPVTVQADASDGGVLWTATLEVDGTVVPNSTILSGNPASYVWTWDATPGPHVIRVRVADVCNKIGTSPPRHVTVQ